MVLDHQSGLSLVSLPSPKDMLDQTQDKLTQRILDNLGDGLDFGVSENVVYAQRLGEIKAFWSLSKFDRSRKPQEIPRLQPERLYQFKDFFRGGFFILFLIIFSSRSVVQLIFLKLSRNIALYWWWRKPPLLPLPLPRREVARPRQQALDEKTHHGGGRETAQLLMCIALWSRGTTKI